jgi:RNA recognition motif-containing protein
MNLSYQTTIEDLYALFEKYGTVLDVEIPFRKGGRGVPLGLGFVRFEAPEAAISAYAELDKTYY